MDLPVELWMHILEHVQTDDYARRAVIQTYDRHPFHRDDRTDNIVARSTLPPFEKHAWVKTKAYYAINRSSRTTAQRLRLSNYLLHRFKAPTKLIPPTTQKQDPPTNETPPAPKPPCHVVVELFHKPLFGRRRDRYIVQDEDLVLALLWTGTWANHPLHSLDLRAAREVVLLAAAPQQSPRSNLDQSSCQFLMAVRDAIEMFWAQNRMPGRRVLAYV